MEVNSSKAASRWRSTWASRCSFSSNSMNSTRYWASAGLSRSISVLRLSRSSLSSDHSLSRLCHSACAAATWLWASSRSGGISGSAVPASPASESKIASRSKGRSWISMSASGRSSVPSAPATSICALIVTSVGPHAAEAMVPAKARKRITFLMVQLLQAITLKLPSWLLPARRRCTRRNSGRKVTAPMPMHQDGGPPGP